MKLVKSKNKIKLNNVRLSFPSVWHKKIWENSKNKARYESTFILNKTTHAKEIEEIKKEIKFLLDVNNITITSPLTHCLRYGDFVIPGVEPKPEFKDSFTLKTTSDERVPILNKNKTPITEDDGLIYGGCYVNAYVYLYPYNNSMGKGVSASFLGMQLVSKGEPFAEVVTIDPEHAFDTIDDGQDDDDF